MAQQPPGWGQPAQQQPPAPQQPGWGPPPGTPPRPGWGQPPPTPPRRGKAGKVLLIVGGVIAGLVVLGSLLPDNSTPTDQNTEATSAPSEAAPDTTAAHPPATRAAKLGTPVRDGKFEFTVKRVRCGVQRIGTTYYNKRAQGQFCLVTTHVSNIGDEAQTLDASNQYLFDRAGRRYETSDANTYLEDSKTFLEEINPGNAVDGTLVFDVPKGLAPSKIELHDSAFSGGVTVQF